MLMSCTGCGRRCRRQVVLVVAACDAWVLQGLAAGAAGQAEADHALAVVLRCSSGMSSSAAAS